MTISAKNWHKVNSLFPPLLDAFLTNQPITLSVPAILFLQPEVVLFENGIPFVSLSKQAFFILLSAKKNELIVPQNLAEKNWLNVIKKNNFVLEAISPKCRTVIFANLFSHVVNRSFTDLLEAISPKCRDVFKFW